MYDTVMRTICEHKLLKSGHKVVVAVSGGPDSLCLLHLLQSFARELDLSLHVVHVHHGLRPESDAEAVFIKKMAIQLGVPATVVRVNVKVQQRIQGTSVQNAARQLRYAALKRVAQRVGAQYIATAHHRDDRVETLLMRLLSGSGLDGLKGMPLWRKLSPAVTVVRPLYHVSRQEIEDYCRTYKLAVLHDPTNEKTDYLRNQVRLRLLPFLQREFGGHIGRTLARTADLLVQDSELMADITRDAFSVVTTSVEQNNVVLDLLKLHALPRALQFRVVRHALWRGGISRLERLHVQQVLQLARNTSPSAQLSLPGGVSASREYALLRIGCQDGQDSPPGDAVEVAIPGRIWLPGWDCWFKTQVLPVEEVKLPLTNRWQACVDYAALSFPLTVRSRKPGERMHPLGAPGERKIKKILADRKIPRHERDKIPLIMYGAKIVWLAGVEIAELFRVTAQTETVLMMEFDYETEKDDDLCRESM